MTFRTLIVTAVAAEADSVARGLPFHGPGSGEVPLPGGFALRRHVAVPEPDPTAVSGEAPARPRSGALADVLVGGVGPAAVAAATATALAVATAPYDLVVSAGIAGGFPSLAPLGSVVVADSLVAADLGAQTPDGFLDVEALGFGRSTHHAPAALTRRVSAALAEGGQRHTVGPVLTVSTVTGTAARAAELTRRHPGAAAEAMEGFGVAEAATAYGVPVVELRAVSNAVGPRDRAAWRIGEALDALRNAFQLLSHSVLVEPAP
ncbi:futalosine hydrolase [Streptomyces sp. NBC_01216]|uniref:futalosine hydrolase n=1 Tax=Streptomyces sp. NBC_01216 TaxID=2903778 RepID=UPI002E12BB33|nr:futalosine hydrolase [Streptomyces sp. NBC_01216]